MVWIGTGLLCLAVLRGRPRKFRKVALLTLEMAPDAIFSPSSSVAAAAPKTAVLCLYA